MARIPVALQLYSVREDCAGDFAGTIRAVAEMGYEGVEFAGYYDWTAQDLRKLLDDLGLKVAGTHTGLDRLLGDELKRTVEFNQIIGNKFLIVPGLPGERTESIAAWRETAQLFNQLAEQVAPYKMRVGYHNHTAEFQPLEGELPWEIFCTNTREEVVTQLDIGHCARAGQDPIEYLHKYPGRAITVHVKPYSAQSDEVVLGEDELDWPTILEVCETVGGTQWYIVEQENYPYPPLESVRRCREALHQIGK